MKDSSVRPAGLLDPRRQGKLLDGLADRFKNCLDQQSAMRQEHDQQSAADDDAFNHQRAEQSAKCREQRRHMLQRWDDAEEQLTGGYEAKVVRCRAELNRLAALFRRKAADERKSVELKVQQREQSLHEQYESCKNQPSVQKRKEIKRIDDSLVTLQGVLEQARELTIRRLDGLPDVALEASTDEEVPVEAPSSVDHAITVIGDLTSQCEAVLAQMRSGRASRIVDSFLLPLVGLVFVLLWALIAYFVAPSPPWLWMLAGVIPAGILVFAVLLILMLPLKRTTARLYPIAARMGHTADQCAAEGRKIAAKNAAEAAAELVRRRDAQLEAAQKWKLEQLALVTERLKKEQEDLRARLQKTLDTADEEYSVDVVRVANEMRAQADAVAQTISDTLSATDRDIQQLRQSRQSLRDASWQHLSNRLRAGVTRGLRRITEASDDVCRRFPDWNSVLSQLPQGDELPQGDVTVDYLPLGALRVGESLARLLQAESIRPNSTQSAAGLSVAGIPQATASGDNGVTSGRRDQDWIAKHEIPTEVPVVLHRRLHSGVVIVAAPTQMDRAVDLAHQVLWRLLTGARPARAKLTLIDPLGRGQHFTSFMALADHDPSLVGHRVWTTDAKIDARLGELAHHVEDVLQASLRDRFERIEDYNEVAGSMAEPYRAVAAVGFPEGLTREGYRHLRALLESGLRCGIFTVLVCDRTKPWPADMPLPSGPKILRLEVDESGSWHLHSPSLESLPFQPAMTPANALRGALIERIGEAAIAASRVEIPLDQILSTDRPGQARQAQATTDDGIEIAIGSQGGNRTLSLRLGEGVRQHVLIAGKTGSGKSTLLHSIITSGAHHYRPDQLQFYLLDFKKGVEFKPYADSGLPHARVIGIESEREFGRSVLQRLDAELQQRGEKFRGAGAQELAEYRRVKGDAMPRIMPVVDEFQELFVRDDRLAGDCTMLLDRLVRQGRSFGMHVVLSSQSLAGAYSLPRATLGQMAVRIAMQCSESDAALILSDDNTAARLISRPGEAIYNDAGGLIEGNQPFQVAWLSSQRHREMLAQITERDRDAARLLPPPVIFGGNRPCRWTPALAQASLGATSKSGLPGLLGESVEIGPPLSIELTRDTGRNLLLMSSADSRSAVLASIISSMQKADPQTKFIYFDGSRADDGPSLGPWLAEAGIAAEVVKIRDSEREMVRLSEQIKQRSEQDPPPSPIVIVIDPLERFRDLRQEEGFNFSLDAAASGPGGSAALQSVLREGPPANVFVILVCGSVETLSRWLPRASQHDLELRVLGQMNASDSALLIDSPIASDLSAATMLLYDDSDGRIAKFRQCDLPDAASVRAWIEGSSLLG